MYAASDHEGRFMVVVGAIIEHEPCKKILLLKRAPTADYLPGIQEDLGGRIKQFAEPEEALRREVKEETGLEIEILKPLTVFHDYRGERISENEMLIITYWYETHSDQVVLSEEHTAYQWITPKEALGFVEHESVRRDIQALIDEMT